MAKAGGRTGDPVEVVQLRLEVVSAAVGQHEQRVRRVSPRPRRWIRLIVTQRRTCMGETLSDGDEKDGS